MIEVHCIEIVFHGNLVPLPTYVYSYTSLDSRMTGSRIRDVLMFENLTSHLLHHHASISIKALTEINKSVILNNKIQYKMKPYVVQGTNRMMTETRSPAPAHPVAVYFYRV